MKKENKLFVNENIAEMWFHFKNSKNLLLYSIPYLKIKEKLLSLKSKINKFSQSLIFFFENFLLFFSKRFFFFYSTKYNKIVFNGIRYIPIKSFLYSQDTLDLFLRVKFTTFLTRKIYFNKKFIVDDLFNLISPIKYHKGPLNLNSLFINKKTVSHPTFKNFILLENFSKNTFSIWDITSDRIILEVFLNVYFSHSKILLNNRYNLFVWVENYILIKKRNKIFHQWLIKNNLINLNREIYFKFFSTLKKKILSKTSEKRKINLKCFKLSFSFSIFKNSNSEINFWRKNLQENWTTLNPEFKTLNRCKINKKNSIIFLTKFLKTEFNYLN
jgi:hypothetical protein